MNQPNHLLFRELSYRELNSLKPTEFEKWNDFPSAFIWQITWQCAKWGYIAMGTYKSMFEMNSGTNGKQHKKLAE